MSSMASALCPDWLSHLQLRPDWLPVGPFTSPRELSPRPKALPSPRQAAQVVMVTEALLGSTGPDCAKERDPRSALMGAGLHPGTGAPPNQRGRWEKAAPPHAAPSPAHPPPVSCTQPPPTGLAPGPAHPPPCTSLWPKVPPFPRPCTRA